MDCALVSTERSKGRATFSRSLSVVLGGKADEAAV